MSKEILIYTYAIENKFSYIIGTDKITVVDLITKNKWDYGFVGLLTKKTKDRLVYQKMEEMLKNRKKPNFKTIENKGQNDHALSGGIEVGKEYKGGK